jgi:hypothetical protein
VQVREEADSAYEAAAVRSQHAVDAAAAARVDALTSQLRMQALDNDSKQAALSQRAAAAEGTVEALLLEAEATAAATDAAAAAAVQGASAAVEADAALQVRVDRVFGCSIEARRCAFLEPCGTAMSAWEMRV